MEITVNGQRRKAADGLTITGLLAELEITVRHVAVEVNQRVVPRTQHDQFRLTSGDQLEVVTLVGGG
jgi:sulfur carrier protein